MDALGLRPEDLAEHVAESADRASRRASKLSPEALAIPGYSSARMRHFLNNLCALPGTRYLEIGAWKGSTLIAASYENHGSFAGVDNFSQFRFRQLLSPRWHLRRNAKRFSSSSRFDFHEADCFEIDLAVLPRGLNVFFYDGDHSVDAQRDVFLRFDPLFAGRFVALVDDWNWREVREGTRQAFERLGYARRYEWEFFSGRNGDKDGWWNGVYVAVIEKTSEPAGEEGCLHDGRVSGASSDV
jgi:hypothetical protein